MTFTINAVLSDSELMVLKTVELKNPFNLASFQKEKVSILDVKAVDEEGQFYNIEIQAEGDRSFIWRGLYYIAKLYSDQLKKGDVYTNLKACIGINLLNFKVFPQIDYIHTCFLFRELKQSQLILTDHMMLHFLELPKLQDQEMKEKLKHWLYFFKNEGLEEVNMETLIKLDADIAKAHKAYKHFTQDSELRDIYEAHMKREMDIKTSLEMAEARGEVKGSRIAILKYLNLQYGIIEGDIVKRIEQINDVQKLDALLDAVFNVNTIENFILSLDKIAPLSDDRMEKI